MVLFGLESMGSGRASFPADSSDSRIQDFVYVGDGNTSASWPENTMHSFISIEIF